MFSICLFFFVNRWPMIEINWSNLYLTQKFLMLLRVYMVALLLPVYWRHFMQKYHSKWDHANLLFWCFALCYIMFLSNLGTVSIHMCNAGLIKTASCFLTSHKQSKYKITFDQEHSVSRSICWPGVCLNMMDMAWLAASNTMAIVWNSMWSCLQNENLGCECGSKFLSFSIIVYKSLQLSWMEWHVIELCSSTVNFLKTLYQGNSWKYSFWHFMLFLEKFCQLHVFCCQIA